MAQPVERRIRELPLELIAGAEELRILRQPARTVPALSDESVSHNLNHLLVLIEDNKVVLNSDEKIVKVVRDGLIRKGGYCPCRLPKNPEFFCPCDEFKGQLTDKEFHGLCHCRLYRKP